MHGFRIFRVGGSLTVFVHIRNYNNLVSSNKILIGILSAGEGGAQIFLTNFVQNFSAGEGGIAIFSQFEGQNAGEGGTRNEQFLLKMPGGGGISSNTDRCGISNRCLI